MKLYIIRHGETKLNALGRLQGWTDEPLNQNGKDLAIITGEALKEIPFDLVITSPLKRARETGELTVAASEKNFGRILKEDLGAYRDELIITTKAGYEMWDGPYGNWGSRKYLLASLDQSLKRMGLDYVDIFYHHRMDPDTPLEETMGALASAVQSGKAIYVGLSNYDGETLKKATAILKDLHCPFVINQNRYSIFDRTVEKNGLKKATAELQKGLITFSPLAQGQLTDRYLHGIPEDSRIRTDGRFLKESTLDEHRLDQIRKLNELAAQRGEKLADMALAWLLQQKEVTSVLIGASKTQQILDNIKAISSAPLTEEELKLIDEISLN